MKGKLLLQMALLALFTGCGKGSQNITPAPTILGKWNLTRKISTTYTNGSITRKDTFDFDNVHYASIYIVFEKDKTIQTNSVDIVPFLGQFNVGSLVSYSLEGNVISYKFAYGYTSSDTIKTLTATHLIARHLFACYQCSPTGEFNVIDENNFVR